MAKPPIRIRRSAVPGAIPTTGQLALGELAVNTFDGKAFLKKDNGTESIVEIGGGGGAYTAPVALALYEKTNSGVADSFDGTETRFQLRDTSGNPVTVSNALYLAISVNGVVQKPNTGTPSSPFEGFYVTANATQGYDIVFDTAPATGADFFGVLAGTFTATSGTSGIKILDDISSQFNGTLTAFTLKYNTANYTPDFPDAVVVSVGGVVQVPTDAYSISGSTITFTSAPPTGASFYALSFEIGTNPDFDVIDSVSSTSTTDAGSANAVKTAYDLANAALPKAGGVVTGNLEIGNTGSLTFEGSTANAFETTLAVTDPTADRTITLPDVSGTVVTTGDTGSVTSAMIADGTIVNGDINASAAIAGTKISPDFGSQNVTTTGTSTAASFIPTSSTAPTNGVYLPAANSVAISTNGTERLYIDSSGNIGINVIPGAWATGFRAIQLRGGGAISNNGNNNDVRFSQNIVIGSGAFAKYIDTAAASVYRQLDGIHIWETAASGTAGGFAFPAERMRISNSGLVGIGTSSPNSLLSVNAGDIALQTVTSRSTELRLKRYDTGSVNGMAAIGLVGAGANGFLGEINFYTGNSDFYDTTLVSRMKIDSSGRVGIGTTSPAAIIHASGSSGSIGLQVTSGSSSGEIAQSGVDFYVVNKANGPTQFWTNGSERARIDSSGRLLVGTSSGSYKFQINALGSGGFAFDDTTGVISNTFGTGGNLGLRAQVSSSSGGGEIFLGGSTRGDANKNRVVCTPGSNGVYLAENATSWTASSDERKKTDLIPIDDALGKVGTLRAVTGRYLTDAEGTSRSFLIAQDVQAVLPEAVDTSDPDSLGVSYTDVIPLLVAALKESKEHIEQLEAEMAAVKAQLS